MSSYNIENQYNLEDFNSDIINMNLNEDSESLNFNPFSELFNNSFNEPQKQEEVENKPDLTRNEAGNSRPILQEENTFKIVEKAYNANDDIDDENSKKSTGLSDNKKSEENEEEFKNIEKNQGIIIHFSTFKQSEKKINEKTKKRQNKYRYNDSDDEEKLSHYKTEKKDDIDVKNERIKEPSNNNINNNIYENKNNIYINLINNNENNDKNNNEIINIQLLNENKEGEDNIFINNKNEENRSEINTINPQIRFNNENNDTNINNKINYKSEDKTKTLISKKRINNCTSDFIGKTIRNGLFKIILKLLNKKIKFYLNNKIKKGIIEQQFQPISKSKLSHSNLNFDKNFLNLKLGEIFSLDITPKITDKLPDHNRKLVKDLINGKEKMHIYFSEVFELTFFECLEHFRGTKNFEVLKDMDSFEDFLDEYEEDVHLELIDGLQKFEKYLNIRRSRRPRT